MSAAYNAAVDVAALIKTKAVWLLALWVQSQTLPRESLRAKRLFLLSSQGANDKANGLHGLNPRNTAPITPVGQRRPALIERLVKRLVSQVETRTAV
jgi:hypothetical protein